MWVLAVAQALYFSAVSVDLTITALAGLSLAPNPALATLPLACINISGALFAYAAGRLAGMYGYRALLIAGASVAVVGGVCSIVALFQTNFVLLCIGTALVGVYRATGNFIRYWAAEHAPEALKTKAVSAIMYGGLVAALLGPLSAAYLAEDFTPKYLGSFALLVLLAVASIAIYSFVPERGQHHGADVAPMPPVRLREVADRPTLALGIATLAASGWMMTMVMAIGPLASEHVGHSEQFNGWMIQLHLIGMFAPSLLSARLVDRVGVLGAGALGAFMTVAGSVAGVASAAQPMMLVTLLCSGVGWNLLFLAGTAIVVRSYPTGRGSRVQAFTEAVTSFVGVAAALSAGALYQLFSWSSVNIPVVVIGSVLLIEMLWLSRRRGQSKQ